MSRFDGKVVVITGGNSGIGLAAAQQFEAEGARVVVTGRDAKTLEGAAKSLGKQALTVTADVTKTSDLDNLFATVREKYGKIDVLFVNAGGAKVASVANTTEALFDEVCNTNFRGAYFTAQKAVPLLSDGAAVIFTTSYFDELGMAGTSVVSATKAAVRSLTRTFASELLPRKIRVNAISPGVIATPIFGKLGVSKEVVEQIGKSLQEEIPFKRFGSPEEIAKAVAFLASSDASYITGIELVVDGGLTQL
jgi:NAD(P)-dependent dehydrogenase (short-subunit alcohol dehydrogenase family)